MSTIVPEPTAGQRFIAQVKQRNASHMIDPGWALLDHNVHDCDLEKIAFAIDHGLIEPSEITWEILGLWQTLCAFSNVQGTELAFEADQLARSVLLVCPSWCDDQHGNPEIEPFCKWLGPGESDSHAGKLADVGKVSIDLVSDVMHPDDGQDSAVYMNLWVAGAGDEDERTFSHVDFAQMEALAADLTADGAH